MEPLADFFAISFILFLLVIGIIALIGDLINKYGLRINLGFWKFEKKPLDYQELYRFVNGKRYQGDNDPGE